MIRKPTLYTSLLLALSLTACGGGASTGTTPTITAQAHTRAPQACVCGPGSIIVSEAFTPTSINGGAGGNSHLVITLTASGEGFSGVNFTDTLPAHLYTIPGYTSAWSNTCGGATKTVPGSSTFSLAGATIQAGKSCEVTFLITGHIPGTYWNEIPANGVKAVGNPTSNAATAALTVTEFNVYPGA